MKDEKKEDESVNDHGLRGSSSDRDSEREGTSLRKVLEEDGADPKSREV